MNIIFFCIISLICRISHPEKEFISQKEESIEFYLYPYHMHRSYLFFTGRGYLSAILFVLIKNKGKTDIFSNWHPFYMKNDSAFFTRPAYKSFFLYKFVRPIENYGNKYDTAYSCRVFQ